MAKNRYINTHFWDDGYIVNLDPIEKLLFLYFLTNPLTNICGIYEIPLKRVAFDTGIDKEMIAKILDRFEKDSKLKYHNGWIAIKNFIKHQAVNTNIQKGIEDNLKVVPKVMHKWSKDNKPFQSLSKPLNYLNLNSNLNINLNTKVDNVLLTEEQLKSLVDTYTEKKIKEKVIDLSNYMYSKGKTYKSHYHTILAWIRKDDKPEKKKNPAMNRHAQGFTGRTQPGG